jgi:hypothetical protein
MPKPCGTAIAYQVQRRVFIYIQSNRRKSL